MAFWEFFDKHEWWTLIFLVIVSGTLCDVAGSFAKAMRRRSKDD